jgi:hypothetical protein
MSLALSAVMKPPSLFAPIALLPLVLAGCSGQETRVQCLLACDDSITFALSTPLAGRDIAITVGEPDGNVLRLDCQPGDGSVACIPVPMRLIPGFDAGGALQSLRLDHSTAGTINVQIAVDGAPAAAASVPYAPSSVTADPCGGGSCARPQTFMIGN